MAVAVMEKVRTNGNGRGGPRAVPVDLRFCPYCGRSLDLFCEARWVYRWDDRLTLNRQLICRRESCVYQASIRGWQ